MVLASNQQLNRKVVKMDDQEQVRTEDNSKTLLEVVTQINKDHKMISKVTDEDTLKTAEEAIAGGIDRSDTRIDEIKAEGKAQTDVTIQRGLYDEYKKLKVQRDRLDTKLKAINKTRTELTDDQKDFFGIPKKPSETGPSSTDS